MREFEIIVFQIPSLSIKGSLVLRTYFKTFCEAFVFEFYIKLRFILRIITYIWKCLILYCIFALFNILINLFSQSERASRLRFVETN